MPAPTDPPRPDRTGAEPGASGPGLSAASGLSRRRLLTGAALAAAGLAARPAAARAAVQAAAGPVQAAAGPVSALRSAAIAAPAATGAQLVTFDPYSLMVGGTRLFVWSGEFHPFRLPSPSLWLDILQKMKASGYNAVCMYFNWAYHSPASGVYDFTGVRDMDLVMRMAADTGIYVLARPGPYINGEVNAGGFPGWLTATTAVARTNDPVYLAAADQWMTAIDAILARHQVTDGSGTLLLYQIENEYASYVGTATGIDYMAHLYAKARADGITVPIYHNDKGRNGDWTPGSFPTGDSNYLYAFDGYPSASSTPPDWGYYGTGGAKGGASASPTTPGFEAEFGGGYFDPWGGAPWAGQGYAYERAFDGPAYERQFYLTNVANGIKLQNVYMTFGGTSWGWLPAAVVYTSYDYGAAIDEARQLTPKIPAMKEMGYFLQSVTDVAKVDPAAPVAASNSLVKTYHLTNPDTGTHFYFVRNDHAADLTFTLPVATADGSYTVPQTGTLQLDGKDMKVLVAAYRLESAHLVYTTSHLMTHAALDGQDIALLASRPGDDGETVLRYPAAAPGSASTGSASTGPAVTVVAGSPVTSAWDPATGDLLLSYTHSGVTQVRIDPGGAARPLLLVLIDDIAAATFWRFDTAAGPVIVSGPELVRSATLRGPVLELTGDTTAATPLEVWGPRQAGALLWNGRPLATSRTPAESVATRSPLAAPPAIALPVIGGWKYATENPESAPGFDDSGWATADKTSSASATPVPAGQPVLFTDDYGFHYGDVWYRGSWSGTAGATSVSISYQTGQVGMFLAWLDGTFLGAGEIPAPTASQSTVQGWAATVTLPISAGSQDDGDHLLAVLVRPMSHQEDGGANNAFKQALGLTSVTFTGASPAVTWRIQGTLGGEAPHDRVRGPLNNGGLYGERAGWYLPGFPARGWTGVSLPSADPRPGVAWYRATFRLQVPQGVDASLGLTISDDPSKSYRAQIFLNGWNLGQYVNNVGPQHTFVLPAGILDSRGENTLAIAVLTDGSTVGGLGSVTLANLGTAAGGVPVVPVLSPGYHSAAH
jgi:beta-galactosidase GanA